MFQLSRSIARPQLLARTFTSSAPKYVSVGDKIPSASLFEASPGNTVDLAKESAEGKSIIIGIPGAFSPACSASHIPGYLKNLRGFNEKGYTKFFIVAVNDPFVTKAFGDKLLENTVANDQLRFLSDPKGEFNRSLDLLFDATKVFGNERSKRYALLVEDGKVTQTFVEPDNAGIDVSEASKVLSQA